MEKFFTYTGAARPSIGYPKNCTSVILGIMILLSGLRIISSAPAPHTHEPEWLSNPCSKQVVLRHHRSAAENQLGIFLRKFGYLNDLRALYDVEKQNLKMNGTCPSKINTLLKPIRNANSFSMATHAFYETLLQFALFMDKLKDIPVKTNAVFDTSKRKDIFKQAKDNLRLVICEYNDTLSKYDTKPLPPSRPKVPKLHTKCLPKEMDKTSALPIDLDFFTKLQKFLKQSRRILKKKRISEGPKKNKNGKKNRTKKSKNK